MSGLKCRRQLALKCGKLLGGKKRYRETTGNECDAGRGLAEDVLAKQRSMTAAGANAADALSLKIKAVACVI